MARQAGRRSRPRGGLGTGATAPRPRTACTRSTWPRTSGTSVAARPRWRSRRGARRCRRHYRARWSRRGSRRSRGMGRWCGSGNGSWRIRFSSSGGDDGGVGGGAGDGGGDGDDVVGGGWGGGGEATVLLEVPISPWLGAGAGRLARLDAVDQSTLLAALLVRTRPLSKEREAGVDLARRLRVSPGGSASPAAPARSQGGRRRGAREALRSKRRGERGAGAGCPDFGCWAGVAMDL